MKLLPLASEGRVRFELSAEPGSQVFVAGTFNNWDPTAHPLTGNPDSGHYNTTLRVPKGTYEYKFVVNGTWTVDPAKCTDWAPDGYGCLNSVLRL